MSKKFSLISFFHKKFSEFFQEVRTQLTSWDFWKDLAVVTFGIIIYIIAFSVFIYPQRVTTGGLTGICQLINIVTGLGVDVPYVIINGTLLLLAFIMLDKNFFLKTLISISILASTITIATRITVPHPELASSYKLLILADQPVVALIIGSMLIGLGLGMVFSVNGSTGGTDVVVAIISKYKNMSFGRIFMFVDGSIVVSSYFVNVYLADNPVLPLKALEMLIYSIIQVLLVSITLDWYIQTNRQSIQFMIFSKKYKEINDAITKKLNRGCTIIEAKGGYTGEERKVLMVVARRRRATMISKVVEEIDPNAFMSQAEVRGVYGQGFESIQNVQ